MATRKINQYSGIYENPVYIIYLHCSFLILVNHSVPDNPFIFFLSFHISQNSNSRNDRKGLRFSLPFCLLFEMAFFNFPRSDSIGWIRSMMFVSELTLLPFIPFTPFNKLLFTGYHFGKKKAREPLKCHSGEGQNPDVVPTKVGNYLNDWTPAFAGVTNLELLEVPASFMSLR